MKISYDTIMHLLMIHCQITKFSRTDFVQISNLFFVEKFIHNFDYREESLFINKICCLSKETEVH